MRRLVALAVAGVALVAPIGCVTQFNNVPLDRPDRSSERSEDVRQLDETKWRRPWMKEQPPHLTPQKIEGGIL